jgi:hypothetical protein
MATLREAAATVLKKKEITLQVVEDRGFLRDALKRHLHQGLRVINVDPHSYYICEFLAQCLTFAGYCGTDLIVFSQRGNKIETGHQTFFLVTTLDNGKISLHHKSAPDMIHPDILYGDRRQRAKAIEEETVKRTRAEIEEKIAKAARSVDPPYVKAEKVAEGRKRSKFSDRNPVDAKPAAVSESKEESQPIPIVKEVSIVIPEPANEDQGNEIDRLFNRYHILEKIVYQEAEKGKHLEDRVQTLEKELALEKQKVKVLAASLDKAEECIGAQLQEIAQQYSDFYADFSKVELPIRQMQNREAEMRQWIQELRSVVFRKK